MPTYTFCYSYFSPCIFLSFFVLFTLHWLQPPRGNSFAFLHMLAHTHTHQNLLPHTPPQGNQVLINGRMANKSHKQMMKLFCVYRRIPLPAPTMQTTRSHAASCRCLNALQPVTGCLRPWHLSPFLRQPGVLSGDTFHTSRCCASMSCVVIVVKKVLLFCPSLSTFTVPGHQHRATLQQCKKSGANSLGDVKQSANRTQQAPFNIRMGRPS